MAWTDERIALLRRYWAEGLSASQIAELLGDGLSRNAVIGKAHRMGLASRPSPLKAAGDKPAETAGKRQAPAKAAAAPAAEAPAAAGAPPARPAGTEPAPPRPPAGRKAARPAKGARVTLLDLNERICKWPLGHPDEADFHFCGKPVNPGFPYCVEHCLVAYQAQMPRRERAPGEAPRPHFGPNLPRPR